jgi:hypothetical protein
VSGVGTDTGTFSASGSLANVSGGNVTVPFTTKLSYGTITGNMTFPEGVLAGSSSVSGSATITTGTGLASKSIGFSLELRSGINSMRADFSVLAVSKNTAARTSNRMLPEQISISPLIAIRGKGIAPPAGRGGVVNNAGNGIARVLNVADVARRRIFGILHLPFITLSASAAYRVKREQHRPQDYRHGLRRD